MLDAQGKPISDNGEKEKSEKPRPDREMTLIVTMKIVNGVYQPVGIKRDSNALENEMAALFMLEKAKDIVKGLHAPVVHRPGRGGNRILNFARSRR